MALLKTHSRSSKPIEIGCLIRLPAIRCHTLIAEVISHDENDVGLRCSGERTTYKCEEHKEEKVADVAIHADD
jgi:hypothetical protein